MFISTTIVTFNRLEYTKKTIESYLENTVIPNELIAVDNASTDGTQAYLQSLGDAGKIKAIVFNPENKFPGGAMNQGWSMASPETTYLVRSDNDLFFHKGWDKEALQAFVDLPKMGQLGLINELFQIPPKYHAPFLDKLMKIGETTVFPPLNPAGNIGGPCMIPKQLYDDGLRWPEDIWIGSVNEDQKFSKIIQMMGFELYELVSNLVEHKGFGDIQKHFDYYFETYGRRGLEKQFFRFLAEEKMGKIKEGKAID